MPDAISPSSFQMQAMEPYSRITGTKDSQETGQSSATGKDPDELKKACNELESLFIFHLLKEMRSTIPKDGLLSGGSGGELYTSMFDAQIARELASERGIGLSTLLMERLKATSGPEEKKVGDE